jgi:hypothetical protein
LIDRFETDDTRNRGVLVPLLRFPNRSRPSSSFWSSTSWQVHKREQMCIPGTRLSAWLPSCVHGLVSVPRLKPKAENEDDDEDEDDWGKKQAGTRYGNAFACCRNVDPIDRSL